MVTQNNAIAYLKKAVIYEVNIRQFTREGTFQSFKKHLPRLKKMGIDILWLMPIYPIGQKNRKGSLGSYYSIQNHVETNLEFGTKDDFRELVNDIHRHGMKIIIDWVANHTSWDHEWTISNPSFYKTDENGQFLSPFDWSDVIQIDHDNEKAHDAMISAMSFWVTEFNIDGFRADLAHLTPLSFWVNARTIIDLQKPGLIWLAETENHFFYQAFDIIYSWTWMHATEDFFKHRGNLHVLIDTLENHLLVNQANSCQLFFTTNHDENSWNGTEFEKYGIYADSLMVFNFLYPYSVPLIYNGQEVPIRQRLLFFEKDEIKWPHVLSNETWFMQLIKYRKSLPNHTFLFFFVLKKVVFGFVRGQGIGSVILICNWGLNEMLVTLTTIISSGIFINKVSSDATEYDENTPIELPVGGFLILEKIT